jgi:hypothetical protein
VRALVEVQDRVLVPLEVPGGGSMITKRQAIRDRNEYASLANVLLTERDRTWDDLTRLANDLMRMRPKSSTTMSAMAKRDVIDFAIKEIEHIRNKL